VREGGKTESWLLSKEELTSLKAGDTYVAAHGKVTYDDVYGVPHWSQICSWTPYARGGYNALSCTKYNTVDKNDEP
jgi:hypothetical protein